MFRTWNILLLIVLIAWIIAYLKNKKTILSLPYLFMLFITPIYNILDQKVFVKVFGCGCVPSVQTNMLNIDFNANNLRLVIYSIITILMVIIGILLSKKMKIKHQKLYSITILLFNLILALKIYVLYMWN